MSSVVKLSLAARTAAPQAQSVSRPAAPGAPEDDGGPVIGRFLRSIWMERGLSDNTLSAYRADLLTLVRWQREQGREIQSTTRGNLQEFIAWRVDQGAQPRSTARQLSSFRRFFRYLLRVPDGFALATHRHNIDLTAVVRRGEQHIIIEEPGKPVRLDLGYLFGDSQGNPHPVSPWGTPTKGYKTRKNKRTDHLIVRRRNAK